MPLAPFLLFLQIFLRSGSSTVAFFVFLAGAAEARFVAADLLAGALLGGSGSAAAGHARGFELAMFLAFELAFKSVDGC